MLEITSLSQFNDLAKRSLLIIDFYATWCGPCKQISPAFEKIATSHSSNQNIVFAKCDVDRNQDVSQSCGITAMPTFQFYKAGNKVDEVRGADVRSLTQKITSLAASVPPTPAGPVMRANGSLRDFFDSKNAVAVNADRAALITVLGSDSIGSASVDSIDGVQMLFHFTFKQSVNLTTLKIAPPVNKAQHAPAKICIGSVPFSKDLSPTAIIQDFRNADGIQTLSLYSDEYTNGIAELKLKASRFKSCKDVTILLDGCLSGDDNVKVAWLDLIGTKA